jgi:polysaccharide deacetylase 2 family uncharacterized protein YibQ
MDEQTPEQQEQERARAGRFSWLTRPLPLALAATAVAAVLSLALWLAFFRQPPAPALHQEAQPPQTLYEESPAQDLEDRVKETDLALLESLRVLDEGARAMTLTDAQVRRSGDESYHVQNLRLNVGRKRQEFLDAFRAALAARAPQARLAEDGSTHLTVSIDGLLTHDILLDGFVKPAPLPPTVPGPKLTIVIDDMGEDLGFAKGLARLPFPVTFSIWPSASQNREVAAVARRAGREILAHVPMQPKGWPEVKPGPQALYTNMSPDEVRDTLRRNLDRLPEAVGINNHMGSGFTESAQDMAAVMDVLAEKGLFFLDSVTTQKSAAPAAARKIGLKIYRRDVFLDNERSVPAIVHQLRLAESLARRSGRAIAIGHPHRETLEALTQWSEERDTRITLVPLATLR